MKPLSDSTLAHLARVADTPEVPGGRYRVISEIGHGGMGTVYLAEDVELGRNVALKVVRALAGNSDAIERIRREARVLAQLEHPGIVPVHDVGTLTDGRAFYVMKHVAGRRLDEHARDGASTTEKLRAFGRICEAVAAAHEKGVVHRDLKPANVHVGPFGEVLVLDWGLAKFARAPASESRVAGDVPRSNGSTALGVGVGTPGYMSPEQARGAADALDARTDVFALGCVLAFLLTLEHPNPDNSGPRALPASVPKALAAIVRKATSFDRAERYADAGELATDIARFQAAESVAAYREGPFDRVARLAGRHRVAILLVLGYLAMRLLLIALKNG